MTPSRLPGRAATPVILLTTPSARQAYCMPAHSFAFIAGHVGGRDAAPPPADVHFTYLPPPPATTLLIRTVVAGVAGW